MGACLSEDSNSRQRQQPNIAINLEKGKDLSLNNQEKSNVRKAPILKPILPATIISPTSNK